MNRKQIYFTDIPRLVINERIANRFKNVLGEYIPSNGHAKRDQEKAYSALKQLQWLGVIPEKLISSKSELLLSLAALYHDIGWSIKEKGNGPHAELSRELIFKHQEKLEKILSKKDIQAIAFIAAHHGTTDVSTDPAFADMGARRKNKLMLLSALLRFADVMDRDPEIHITHIDFVYMAEQKNVLVVCRDKKFAFISPEKAFGAAYEDFVDNYFLKVALLEEILGLKFELVDDAGYTALMESNLLAKSFISYDMQRELDLQRNNSRLKKPIITEKDLLVVRFGEPPKGKVKTQEIIMPRPVQSTALAFRN